MNKKNILTVVGIVVAFVVVILITAMVQVGLPRIVGQKISVGFGGGVGESLSVGSAKLMAIDRAISSPMSATVPAPIGDNSVLPRKITKTGSISILVDTAEAAATNIQAIAGSMAGYVSDSYLYEVTPGVKAGAITIRVPADKFDQTLARIKELALKVENENINANDVTDQFIDLDARLKNLKAQETQYLDILKKAQKVEDVLNVTNQLNQVRQQIDSLQGQLKYLNSQVDLSTITVNLTAEKEVQIWGINWRPITVIKQAVRSLLNGLVNYVNAIIAIIIFLPVIALWIITLLIVIWVIWRVVKRVKNGPVPKKITEKASKKTKKSITG